MTCTCIPCSECRGSGTVWFSFSGKYLGSHRSDDLDEMDTCDECRGSCVSEICEYCLEKQEEDAYQEFLKWSETEKK